MKIERNKIKVFRIVTASEAVSFHLRNTLNFKNDDFETTVIGDHVEDFRDQFPEIRFKNLRIDRKINLYSDVCAVFRLFLLFLREKPQIVHSIMPKAGLLSALASFFAGVPIRIHTFTGQTWASSTGLRKQLLISLDQTVNFLNTICYTDSPSQSEFLHANHISRKGRPLPFLGRGSLSGVDLNRFNSETIRPIKAEVRASLKIGLNDTLFTYLGRKNREKGIFELVQAYKLVSERCENTRLLLVGPDETDGSLMQYLKTLNVDIIDLPITSSPEIYINASDVFCLPSYREGFGSTVIEAAALGIPSIGSEIPGLVDSIVDQKTGLLVPPRDVAALFEAMARLHADRALRDRLATNAYENARNNYDSKKLYQYLCESYRALVDEIIPS